MNAEEIWDFDSGDYSKQAKQNKAPKEKVTEQRYKAEPVSGKNVNKGDVDEIFDDLGEEEFWYHISL